MTDKVHSRATFVCSDFKASLHNVQWFIKKLLEPLTSTFQKAVQQENKFSSIFLAYFWNSVWRIPVVEHKPYDHTKSVMKGHLYQKIIE
jgi:hypothetical protein